MKKYLFICRENNPKATEDVAVIASEHAIRCRMYEGGFLRFLSSCYDDAGKYEGMTEFQGMPVLNLKQFDSWRKENKLC